MRVVVDADVLAYQGGFAAQRTVYEYAVLNSAGSVVECSITADKDELDALQAELPFGHTLQTHPFAEPEPLVNALAMTKRTLLKIEEAMDQHGCEFDRLELFLTGKGNFRDEIAQLRGYKANRIGVEKPVHYKAIRRYMRERWKAKVVHGYEADDAVAMCAHENEYDPERVCIVSGDKDLLTVPGRLYNFRTKQMRIVTPQEALVAFYRQVLTGDVVDNIAGCYKVGPAAAEKIVTPDMDEDTMARATLAAFETSKGKKGCPYTDRESSSIFLETARLVHMARTVRETFTSGWWLPPWERDVSEFSLRVSSQG
jgi:hypothetical protein